MKAESESRRFIFHTKGVCPPEIHFQLNDGVVEEIRFVGGGCPGNAQLVSRFIQGRPVVEILPVLEGIECREKTSCPDQLSVALSSAVDGSLLDADTLRILNDPTLHKRVGLAGILDGNAEVLQKILRGMQSREVEAAYCMGNFTGLSKNSRDAIRLLRGERDMLCIQGERDWLYANNLEEGMPPMSSKDRDWIAMLPHLVTFQLGNLKAVAFHGDYLQSLPGFSDFSPYGLEINMVCGLTDFMADETVFSALEAMFPQFQSDMVLFGQRPDWGQWRVGEKDFISVGRSDQDGAAKWGFLETTPKGIRFEVIEESV